MLKLLITAVLLLAPNRAVPINTNTSAAKPTSSFKKFGPFVLDFHPITLAQAPKLPWQFSKPQVAVIVVDIATNTAAEYVDGELVWCCRASTAASSYQTPCGTFRVTKVCWRPSLRPGENARAEYRRKRHRELPDCLPSGDPRNGKGIAELILKGGGDIRLHGNMDQTWVGTKCTLGCASLGNGDLVQMIQNFASITRRYVLIENHSLPG